MGEVPHARSIAAVMTRPRKINPPHWALACLAAEIALDHWMPIERFIPRPFNYLGGLIIAAGWPIPIGPALLSKRAKAELVPSGDSSWRVTAGPYRLPRNPMYVEMFGVLPGPAVILGSATPFFLPPVFIAIITV